MWPLSAGSIPTIDDQRSGNDGAGGQRPEQDHGNPPVATNAAALTYVTAPTLPTTYAASDERLGTAVSVATPSGTMTR